ncbi:MAG TPA: hypothetical protein VGP25_20245 [Gemmatimonadaceae bacterium]|jgi:hypothetical protein|nr:hypothetical protein [Gemmatimonadaceae bacterium]
MRRPSGSFLFSVAFHSALLFVLANVVLHYDIVFAPKPTVPAPTEERVSYVSLSPPAGAVGGTTTTPPARATEPTKRLVAPPRVPTGVPRSVPTPPAAGGTPGGVVGGTGAGGGVGPTTGIVPGDPDPRLSADSKFFYPAPKTHGQRVDSAVKATILAFNDSVANAAANAGKRPGDWTFENNGKKWGIDGNKIYLGKFAIPSAVLAALPIRIQGNPGETIADRLVTTRRGDVLLHAQSQFHDDEFKSAVKRIRERKERERREKEKANDPRGVAQSSSEGGR